MEYFSFKADNYVGASTRENIPISPWIRIYIRSCGRIYFLGGENVSWITMNRQGAAICQLWKFYDFCFLIVFSRNELLLS